MRRDIVVLVMVLMAIMAINAGCGGYRHASLSRDADGGISHRGWNASLFNPDASATELAMAYSEMKRADNEALLMSAYQGEAVAARSRFSMAVVNQSSQRAWVIHPEIGNSLPLAPNGGHQFLFLSYQPVYLDLKNGKGKITSVRIPRRDFGREGVPIFRGTQVDRIYTITRDF